MTVADQQQVMQLLWLALYVLLGVGVIAVKCAIKDVPACWSPSGMLRKLERDAEDDRDLDEILGSYPAGVAVAVAVSWVFAVLAWPLLLMTWTVSGVRRLCSRN